MSMSSFAGGVVLRHSDNRDALRDHEPTITLTRGVRDHSALRQRSPSRFAFMESFLGTRHSVE
jgi:hypothetical protein